MPQIKRGWSVLSLLLGILIAAAGCSGANGSASNDETTGKHRQTDWIEKHRHAFLDIFLDHPEVCEECHGSAPVLKGGISKVSCFNVKCHNSANGAPVSHHNTELTTWIGPPPLHGQSAMMAPSRDSGFKSCEVCHGVYFTGGFSNKTCFLSCHGNAPSPHPNNWLSENTYTHTKANEGNTHVCSLCHTHRANLPADAAALLPAFKPSPAGTPAGCFNNTLCHGTVSFHPDNWGDPAVHGPVVKAAPGTESGFSNCQVCHGTDFSGNGSGVACASCHGVPAPHPQASDWRSSGTITHQTTNQGNAPLCSICHTNRQNLAAAGVELLPPFTFNSAAANSGTFGCFNSTLCHGTLSGHGITWAVDHSLQAAGYAAIANVETNCGSSSCHGTAATVLGEPTLTGGTGPGCSTCHLGGATSNARIMHPFRWPQPLSSHPKYLEGLGNNASSCNPASPDGFNVASYCHGQGLTSNATRTSPPNGSWEAGPSCFECHEKEWHF